MLEKSLWGAWPLGQVDVTCQEATEVGDVLNKPTQVRLIHAPNSNFPGATLEHTGRSIIFVTNLVHRLEMLTLLI